MAKAAPWSPHGFKWFWRRGRARWLEHRRDYSGALRAYEEVARIGPLTPTDKVLKAGLLLAKREIREAHDAFSQLRTEFSGSDDPDVQYLRHYCTFMLSGFPGMNSGQAAYEARQAKQVKCRPSLKRLFPMRTTEEIHDSSEPQS